MMFQMGVAQSITFIFGGIILIIILLNILRLVHRQQKRVRELELRMQAMEQAEEQSNVVYKGE